jgi:hypothetical protein
LVDGRRINKQLSADDMKTSRRPIGQYCEGSCYGLVKALSYSNREKKNTKNSVMTASVPGGIQTEDL